MIKKTKGFTLIELLVVIAIIGILSSVVLASLNSARQKGKDAAFKAEASNLVAHALINCDGKASTTAMGVAFAGGTVSVGSSTTCGLFAQDGAGVTISSSQNTVSGAYTGTCTATVKENGAVFSGC